MAYKHLQDFINALERAGELVRIKSRVSPHLEIAEITDRISKSGGGGKALLFENTGYDFPLLINAMGSYRRMCMALGVKELDDVAGEIESLIRMVTRPRENILDKLSLLPKLGTFASWMPKVTGGRGACQEVVMTDPDLYRLPVLTCWPKDGGPFITLPVIHTRDLHTGIRNVGMYRMQVFSKDMTGMHWHKHKVSARHFDAYREAGKRMPVAVALGGDPVYTYAATAPLPDNVDEYMLAGFLRKKKVELVKCLTQPELEVPADADFIIEGYVDPAEEPVWEGPFGDHTGYYSLPDWYPRFHVTAVTHRRNAVYPATIVGIPPQEDAWIGKATERIFLAPIKMTLVPEIVDMEMPVEGVFHNLVIAQIKKTYAGQAQKVMNAMWGAGQMMFNKILVVVDETADIHDYQKLAQQVFRNLDPASDVYFSQGPMDVLDHSCSKMGFGGKMCIDGTVKFEEEKPAGVRTVAIAPAVNTETLRKDFPEIRDGNLSLAAGGIPCLLLAVEKNRKGHIGQLHVELAAKPELQGIRMILYVDAAVDVQDVADALWRFCNNLDPRRDHYLSSGIMGLDGTLKTKAWDDFQRDWPNIIVADNATISAVDQRWNELDLGPFIPSPSLKYRDQLYGEDAVAKA
ncbi:menaquinone biosynthesis decarboxylase [Compostibacter hankyongensis]|uniref:Menaquinone biosynthesis decarboxylase n=1 Tax=Compostibacter hankyongensis TaxID=1007089 RepID=A0ABP8FN71_9BACT